MLARSAGEPSYALADQDAIERKDHLRGLSYAWLDGQHIYPAKARAEVNLAKVGQCRPVLFLGVLGFSGKPQSAALIERLHAARAAMLALARDAA